MIFNINKNMKESSFKIEVDLNKEKDIENRIEFDILNCVSTYIIDIIAILNIINIIRREEMLLPYSWEGVSK